MVVIVDLVGGLEHEFFIFPSSWDDDPIRLSYFFRGGEPPISIDHIRLGNGVFHQLATLGPTDKVVIDRGFWQQFLWACNYNNEYSYRIRKLMIYIYIYIYKL